MFDLNIDVNITQKITIDEHDHQEGSCSATDQLSGTSSASSLVAGRDTGGGTGCGEIDFFSNEAVSGLVTRELFPMSDVMRVDEVRVELSGLNSRRSRTGSSSNKNNNQWLNLGTSMGTDTGTGMEEKSNSNVKQEVRRSRRGPRSRSSQYRGVTFYRRTGRWESHIWDCGKQVYLGGFDTAHAAARAYDRAAIKFRGVDADINFTIADYEEDRKQMNNLTKEEFIQILRRQSTGFSRGNSRFRGVTLNKSGRWEPRMGQFIGREAYENGASNGREAVTSFDPSLHRRLPIMQVNNEGEEQNLNLNLGISSTIYGPKGSEDKGVGKSQPQHSVLHLANGKWPVNGSSAYFTSGAPTLYGQPLSSKQTTMWSGISPGQATTYQDKGGGPKLDEPITATGRLPNWACYMQNQGQGGSNGGGVGGTANQVPPSSTAASSGFSSFSNTAPPSTHHVTNFHTDFNHGPGR